MTIKAIETRYKGCRFRSRLEARWAVFFDALKLNWEYEPEGFELTTGESAYIFGGTERVKYLPDFFLTHWTSTDLEKGMLPGFRGTKGMFVEIKPTNLSMAEHEKLNLLTLALGQESLALCGDIGSDNFVFHHIKRTRWEEDPRAKCSCGGFLGTPDWKDATVGWRNPFIGATCISPYCPQPLGYTKGHRIIDPNRPAVPHTHSYATLQYTLGSHSDSFVTGTAIDFDHALSKAKSARFEHGENT